jgi:hypothetical protein
MTKSQPLNSIVEIAKKAMAERDQLGLGRLIASEVDQREANMADLAKVAKRIGCSARTVHYAIAVYRLAERLGLTPEEVRKIGWTKLAVVAAAKRGVATKSDLVALCRGRTVAELRAALSGIPGAVKTVVFTLNKGQKANLDAALIRFGATRSGRGLFGREEALMKILSKVG